MRYEKGRSETKEGGTEEEEADQIGSKGKNDRTQQGITRYARMRANDRH